MQVIKKINNNCAMCLDSKNRKVVAFGNGIGFKSPPHEVSLSEIHRTYYDIDESYVKMINDIPEDILELSAKVIEYAKTKIDSLTNSNVVFTLADHITFAIKRYKENINIKLPIIHDIQYLYDIEMNIGMKALQLFREQLHVNLPDEEAVYIALHIINAETMNEKQRNKNFDEKVIDEILNIIKSSMKMDFDKQEFNYSRFVTHLYYLLNRGKKNAWEVNEHNQHIYHSLITSLPVIYECTIKIKVYFNTTLKWELSDEECMYLMLHINRLCNRENFKNKSSL